MKAYQEEIQRLQTAIGDLTSVVAHVRNDISIIRSIGDASTTAANAQAVSLDVTRERLRQLELSVRSKAGRCQQRHNTVHGSGTSALDDVQSTARHLANSLVRLESRINALTENTMRWMDDHDRMQLPHDPADLDRLHTELTIDATQPVIDPPRDNTTRSSGPRPSTPSEQVAVS